MEKAHDAYIARKKLCSPDDAKFRTAAAEAADDKTGTKGTRGIKQALSDIVNDEVRTVKKAGKHAKSAAKRDAHPVWRLPFEDYVPMRRAFRPRPTGREPTPFAGSTFGTLGPASASSAATLAAVFPFG